MHVILNKEGDGMGKGKLFVIDGNDGSGKQTQAEMLRSSLAVRGRKVLTMSFPRYDATFFGKELRKALDGQYGDFVALDPHIASLLYAGDRWASKHEITRALSSGEIVICDRYVSANQIHQGGKIKDELKREEFLTWLDQLEYGEYSLPRPDISIYLDVPPEVSTKLMSDKTRDIVENNPEYLFNSHKSAQWLIARRPNDWIRINCMNDGNLRSRGDVHDEISHWLYEKGFI
jgi:dTMP kinase